MLQAPACTTLVVSPAPRTASESICIKSLSSDYVAMAE